jgi:putative spermidine/putrescine transport system permease protein
VRRRPGRAALLAVPALAFVAVLFVLPFLAVARVSVAGPALPGSGRLVDLSVLAPGNLAALARDPLFASVLGVTLRLGLLVTVLCMALAVPFAACVHTARGWWRGLLVASVALPKLVNLLVLLYGVLLLLGNAGFLNAALLASGLAERPLPLFGNLPAVVVTEVLVVLPYPALLLAAAFCAADPRQGEAARSLGAGPVRAYAETVLRPAAPALGGAALLSAVWGVGAFAGPLVLGNPPYYTVAVEVYDRALIRLAPVDAAGWALLGVAALAAALAIPALLLRRWRA